MKPATAGKKRYEITHGGKYAVVRSGSGKMRKYHGIVRFDEIPDWRKKQYYARTKGKSK